MLAAKRCIQCLYEGQFDAGVKFCPRCGSPLSAEPGGEIRLKLASATVTVGDRLAFGDLCNLYLCEVRGIKGLFKIARTPTANRHVVNEALMLRRLHEGDSEKKSAPFLPLVVESIQYDDGSGGGHRQANVLTYFEGIKGPGNLHSLQEVRAAYPDGIDARDMAWMWRRLLTILGHMHRQRIGHTAITPDHVLIEPDGHKLVLVGFCAASPFGTIPQLVPVRWQKWIEATETRPAPVSASRDLKWAARSMEYLLGENVEPGIVRHLERAKECEDAWKLLDDFDKLIEALWGQRVFRPFTMPRP